VAGKWWTKPYANSPCTSINSDCSFVCDITTGGSDQFATQIAIFLLPIEISCPVILGGASLPSELYSQSKAYKIIERSEAVCPKIKFSGYDWTVKVFEDFAVGPGPNRFGCDNVWADAEGLHLSIKKKNDVWYCAEVILDNYLGGYGQYIFHTRGRLDLMDPCMVLGLFTWDDDAPSPYREIDFEISQWCEPQEEKNVQFVVQPWDIPGDRERFAVSKDVLNLTFILCWQQGSAAFSCYNGHYTAQPPISALIHKKTITGDGIPVPGGEEIRINFWLNEGRAPLSDNEAEFTITHFSYSPNCFDATDAPNSFMSY